MRVIFAGIFLLSGCDKLFPELYGQMPPDMAMPDAAGDGAVTTPHIAGQICALADLRDYRSCGVRGGVFRVTVEETREMTMTDTTGHFMLPLSAKLDSVTLAAIDTANQFAPSIVPLRLKDGVLDPVAVPVLSATVRDQAALEMGFSPDPARGAVLAWVVDSAGLPQSGVSLQKPGGLGPYSDGAAPNQIQADPTSNAHGLLALFNLAAPTTRYTLSIAGKTNSFDLPVRNGALTLSTLVF